MSKLIGEGGFGCVFTWFNCNGKIDDSKTRKNMLVKFKRSFKRNGGRYWK